MKPSRVGQDFNHTGIKYPMITDIKPYPRWIAWVFLGVAAAVFSVVIFGFMQL